MKVNYKAIDTVPSKTKLVLQLPEFVVKALPEYVEQGAIRSIDNFVEDAITDGFEESLIINKRNLYREGTLPLVVNISSSEAFKVGLRATRMNRDVSDLIENALIRPILLVEDMIQTMEDYKLEVALQE